MILASGFPSYAGWTDAIEYRLLSRPLDLHFQSLRVLVGLVQAWFLLWLLVAGFLTLPKVTLSWQGYSSTWSIGLDACPCLRPTSILLDSGISDLRWEIFGIWNWYFSFMPSQFSLPKYSPQVTKLGSPFLPSGSWGLSSSHGLKHLPGKCEGRKSSDCAWAGK